MILIIVATAASAAPIKMSSGFYYPTERTWTGDDGSSKGDPKQPWNDGSPGGRIYGFLDPDGPKYLGKDHVGMDIRTNYNSPVYAITSGTIHRYYNSGDSRYWCIIVKHKLANGSTFYGVYGHCRMKSGYSVGTTLDAGEVIGYINESVNQHIHFGIKLNDDFSTGWGHLDTSIDAYSIGWRPPRTWMLSNTPPGSNEEDDDDTPPTISISGPAVSTLYNSPQYINWNVTDTGSGTSTITMQWDGYGKTDISASGTTQIPMGKRYVTIRASDAAGNTSEKKAGPYWVHTVVLTVAPGVFEEGFYVQQHDRAHGMAILSGYSSDTTLTEGDKVYITSGEMTTASGERAVESAVLERMGTANPLPEPLYVTCRSIAGAGLSNFGLLIKTSGKVTYVDPSGKFFYIDDGSCTFDGIMNGVRVRCDGFADDSTLSVPGLGRFVAVTGICAAVIDQNKHIRVVRPRQQSDIVVIK